MLDSIGKQNNDVPGSINGDAILATLAGLVGLLVRLPAALSVSFPLNDGGLFYQMILDLQANRFRLPLYTTYNAAHIPFAYPPLALYLAALLATATHIDVLDVLRIAPPIISSLCVPAFYYSARGILKGEQRTVLAATLAFALTPRAFEWQIMGGGLTRALGFLFALLTWRAAHALFIEGSPRRIIWTTVWGTLTVLSHPEAAVQCALGALILYLVLARSRRGTILAGIVAAAAAVLTAPWWATVLAYHGPAPFLAALAAAREGTLIDLPARIFLTFQFSFSGELYLPFIAVLGLLGLFAELTRRRWLLPLWVVVPLFAEPRSAPQFMTVPLAMLAGIGLMDVIVPALKNIAAHWSVSTPKAVNWLLVYLAVYLLLSAYLTAANIAHSVTLRPSERAALSWVRDYTPVDSKFVIVTQGNALADPLVEWFPALAKRRSLDTVFGSEWLAGVSFRSKIQQYDSLQSCMGEEEGCLQAWMRNFGQGFTHVLIQKNGGPSVLLASLRRSVKYKLIHETADFAIFERQ